MRRSLTLLALLAVAAFIAACSSSSSAPGWTYAAPTSPPPSQPAASGSAQPSAEAPSGGGGGVGAVAITAEGVQFVEKTVSAPAGQAFVIHFDNKDAGQPHNVEIKDGSGAVVFKGDLVTGPGQADYQVPALAAGSYPFVCTVHANMMGTLTAG